MPRGVYHRTPEMIENYRRAAKSRVYTAEGRAKISASRKGKPSNALGHKMTDAHRELMRQVNLGKGNHKGYKHTLDARLQISRNRVGLTARENNPNWKGGTSRTDRKSAMQTGAYRSWRLQVFERDDYTCQFCHERGGKLHADHIQPYATHPELRFEISNGRTLCEDCHRKTPTYGYNAINY